MINVYSKKMKSLEHLKIAAYIMGYDSVDEFKKKYSEVETMYKAGKLREYRYSGAFETAQCFWDFISSENLGTKN